MNTAVKLTKGEETRAHILKAALRKASIGGFEALTIGSLAEQTGLSKSGLFAHFGSKEELQIATLDEAVRRFHEAATYPALSAPRGLQRLTALFENWLTWTARSDLTACPLMTASMEYDDKPGPVRDAMLRHSRTLQEGMVTAIRMTIDTGEFSASTDAEQIAFELFGIISGYYRLRNLFPGKNASHHAKQAFNRLVSSALSAQSQYRSAVSIRSPI